MRKTTVEESLSPKVWNKMRGEEHELFQEYEDAYARQHHSKQENPSIRILEEYPSQHEKMNWRTIY